MQNNYWYFRTYLTCYVCGGKGDFYQKRMYTKRPKRFKNRNDFDSSYCGCMEHLFY